MGKDLQRKTLDQETDPGEWITSWPGHAQNGQWQPELVVKILFRTPSVEFLGYHDKNRLFGRGLSHAAGNADNDGVVLLDSFFSKECEEVCRVCFIAV